MRAALLRWAPWFERPLCRSAAHFLAERILGERENFLRVSSLMRKEGGTL